VKKPKSDMTLVLAQFLPGTVLFQLSSTVSHCLYHQTEIADMQALELSPRPQNSIVVLRP
jgi:hypothetical protein